MNERIHYEPHPVTPERKAELRAQGLRIIDARFAPVGWQPPTEPQDEPESTDAAEPKRRGRPPKAKD